QQVLCPNANANDRSVGLITQLPFGKGQRFGAGSHGMGGWLIGGWQTNGILRFQTGQAFSLIAGVDVNGNGVVNDRAALLSGDLSKALNPDFGKNGSRQYLVNGNGATLGVSRTPEAIG